MAVKTSKYRFTKPTPCTKAKEVINISATSAIWDSGNFLAVNEKHIAIPWAQMGAVVILGHHDYGKVPTTPSTFVGHTGPVIDLAFNPFNPDMLVTASEDATIKTWKIPETGLKGPSNGPVSTLAGHSKKVGILSWHPAAHNVLASSGPDSVVNLWDVQVEAPKIAITTHKDQVFGVQWNLDGTLLATTSKDKKVNVIDSRTGEIGISADAHQGSKTQRLVWAKRRGLIVTVGFNRQQFRQAMVWDIRNMEKPVCTEEIDQQSSVMAPYIDEDTNVLYIAGKGDGTIKFYELWDDAKPITYVNQFATNDAQRGIALMPKKSLDIKSCEVARIYRLTPKMLHHISFTVPRKTGETEFQEDLFPPTFADVPAIDADAFFSGKNAEPNLVSLQNLFTPGAASTGIIAGKVVADSSVPASPSKGGAVDASSPAKASNEWDGSSEPTPAQLTKQRDEIATLKAALEAAEKKLATMESKVPKAAEVKPVVEEAKPVAPAESTPAATEAKPVEAKPAETKPVEAKPVEVAAAKPSEEPAAKPAEEKPTTVVAEEHKSNGDAASEPAKPAEEAVKPAAAEDAPKAEEPKAAESTA